MCGWIQGSDEVRGKPRFIAVTSVEDVQAIRTVAFHPEGNLFVVGANSKTLRICRFPATADLRFFNSYIIIKSVMLFAVNNIWGWVQGTGCSFKSTPTQKPWFLGNVWFFVLNCAHFFRSLLSTGPVFRGIFTERMTERWKCRLHDRVLNCVLSPSQYHHIFWQMPYDPSALPAIILSTVLCVSVSVYGKVSMKGWAYDAADSDIIMEGVCPFCHEQKSWPVRLHPLVHVIFWCSFNQRFALHEWHRRDIDFYNMEILPYQTFAILCDVNFIGPMCDLCQPFKTDNVIVSNGIIVTFLVRLPCSSLLCTSDHTPCLWLSVTLLGWYSRRRGLTISPCCFTGSRLLSGCPTRSLFCCTNVIMVWTTTTSRHWRRSTSSTSLAVWHTWLGCLPLTTECYLLCSLICGTVFHCMSPLIWLSPPFAVI